MLRHLIICFMLLIFSLPAFGYEFGTQSTVPAKNVSFLASSGARDIAALVSKEDQLLYVVDTKSGSISAQIPLDAPPSGLSIQDEKIIVTAVSGQIWAFAFSGEIVSMTNTGDQIISSANYANGSIIYSSGEKVNVVNIENGEVKTINERKGGNFKVFSGRGWAAEVDVIAGESTLTMIEPATGEARISKITGTISSLDVDDELELVVLTLSGKTGLQLLDYTSLAPIGEIEVDKLIANVSVNRSTHAAVMSSLADGSLIVVDLNERLVEGRYPLFDSVAGTAADDARNIAFAALNQGVTAIKLQNPVPSIESLNPDNVMAGNDGFPIAISGQKFTKETQAFFNNKPFSTLFNSTNLLSGEILPDEVIYPGDVKVAVSNPVPGGGQSNVLVFKVLTPIPQVTAVTPKQIPLNQASVVRIEGKNFLPNARVFVDEVEVSTYFVSSIVLEIKMSGVITASTGLRKVSVVNTGERTASSNTAEVSVVAADSITTPTTVLAMTTKKGALRGRVLNTSKKPVENVTVSYKGLFAKTNKDGVFVLDGIPEGRRTVLVDGSTAIDEVGFYPSIPVTAEIVADTQNQLSFTPHLHRQKKKNFVKIKPGQETVVTDPDIKGFEMRIQKGNRVVGWDGKINERISVRTVPTDRLPIRPLPEKTNVRTVLMFFFDKVGGGRPDQPVPFKTPNNLGLLPGEKATIWYYDESSADGEAPNDWAISGTGTVSRDGRFIVTDPGVGIPKFCCGATAISGLQSTFPKMTGSTNCPKNLPGNTNNGPAAPVSAPTKAMDPVDVATGFFIHEETDLVVPGIIPVKISRTYNSQLSGSSVSANGGDGLGSFGKGFSIDYDLRVDTYADMIRMSLAGGHYYDFALQADGSYTNTSNPEYIGAKFVIESGLRKMKTRDGWVYTFEAQGGLVGLADRNENSISIVRRHELDAGGYIEKIINAEGKIIVFDQDYTGNFFQTNSIFAPGVGAVNYTYEADPFSAYPRLKRVNRDDGSTVSYTYSDQGKMKSAIDSKGNILFDNTYDTAGRVISQALADGSISTMSYVVTGGNVTETTETRENGSERTWRFNPWGYTSEYTAPEGTVTYQTDSGGNYITSVTDPLNRTTTYTYYTSNDAKNGQVSSITDSAGNVTSFDYEPVYGLLSRVTDAQGKEVTTAYTVVNGKITKTETRDPQQNLTTVQFTAFGLPSSVTDPNGNTSTMVYDPVNPYQMVSVSDALGNTSTYTYDVAGRAVVVTDPKGASSSFEYDPMGRIVNMNHPEENQTSYEYDLNGNLKALLDPKGNRTSYEYDAMDRLAKTTDRLGRIETYAYYAGAEVTAATGTNLKSYTDKRGQKTTFNTYDAGGRPTLVTFADGATLQYVYDSIGRLTSVTDSVSGTISYGYDTLGRVTSETTPGGTVSYTYDTLGRRASMTAPGAPAVTYGYDTAGRLATITRAIAGSPRTYNLTYDAGSRRSNLQLPLLSGTINTGYAFDVANRLSGITHQGPTGPLDGISYVVDPNGNRTGINRSAGMTVPPAMTGTSYNSEYEMLSYNGNTLTYDENGNLTTKTDPGGVVTSYTWDARNRLVGMSSPSLVASFSYDAAGRRISKVINGLTTTYVYDGVDIASETTAGVTTHYIRTLGVDEPLSKISDAAGVQHYLRDGLGSTIAMVDDSGNLISSAVYDVHGNTVSGDEFGFTGRENDGTGLMYYRARYYSPEMGRFISRDPLEYSAGDVNFYNYVGNNSANFTDPSGKIWIVPAIAAVGGGLANAWSNYEALQKKKINRSQYAISIVYGATFAMLGTLPSGFVAGALVSGVFGGMNDILNQEQVKDDCENYDLAHIGREAIASSITGVFGKAISKYGIGTLVKQSPNAIAIKSTPGLMKNASDILENSIGVAGQSATNFYDVTHKKE